VALFINLDLPFLSNYDKLLNYGGIMSTYQIEKDVKEIKSQLIDISKKLDELLYERDISVLMKLSEKSLINFFESEDVVYNISDLKIRYK